ncbi:hypothetical protein FRC12_004953, partial [Ceratobasidium sp. 428]
MMGTQIKYQPTRIRISNTQYNKSTEHHFELTKFFNTLGLHLLHQSGLGPKLAGLTMSNASRQVLMRDESHNLLTCNQPVAGPSNQPIAGPSNQPIAGPSIQPVAGPNEQPVLNNAQRAQRARCERERAQREAAAAQIQAQGPMQPQIQPQPPTNAQLAQRARRARERAEHDQGNLPVGVPVPLAPAVPLLPAALPVQPVPAVPAVPMVPAVAAMIPVVPAVVPAVPPQPIQEQGPVAAVANANVAGDGNNIAGN